MSIPLAERLIQRFRATHTMPPEWAWPVAPPIPFVGRNYKPGRGLLVYASAENLTWWNGRDERCKYFAEPSAWNRYRLQYTNDVRNSRDQFFPNIGIQPVNDGGLLTAALFVSQLLGLPTAARPRTFLEKIAVSNWCKFVRRDSRDYRDLRRLTPSLSFVVGELAELRPAVVLLAKGGVWSRSVLQAAMRGASPSTLFIPVYQFTPLVVHGRTLTRYGPAADRLRDRLAGTRLECWMKELSPRLRSDHAWRYLAYLEEALASARSG